jgi:hypothetical protein
MSQVPFRGTYIYHRLNYIILFPQRFANPDTGLPDSLISFKQLGAPVDFYLHKYMVRSLRYINHHEVYNTSDKFRVH